MTHTIKTSIKCDSGDIIVQAVSMFYQWNLPVNQHDQTAERGHVDRFQNIVSTGRPLFQSFLRLDWAGNSMETHD